MIPRYANFSLAPDLPANAAYWLPGVEDVDSDGFGGYHGTWYLATDLDEAALIQQTENEVLTLLDRLATDADEFDRLARAVEFGDADSVDDLLRRPWGSNLGEYIAEDDFPVLQGLEVGVAGLCFSLAAAGCPTAASCRGHSGWSEFPRVVFAANRQNAEALLPLVRNAGCGFDLDGWGQQLLAIGAPSVRNLAVLAEAILGSAAAFHPHDIDIDLH